MIPKKIIVLSICTIFLTNVFSKAKATEECFEKVSRPIFKFNMAFDDAIMEPVAKGYNKLLRFVSIIVAKILNQNYIFSIPINKISTFTLLKHFKNCHVFCLEPPKKLSEDETEKLFNNVLQEFEANFAILVPVDDNLAAAIEFVKQWKIKK